MGEVDSLQVPKKTVYVLVVQFVTGLILFMIGVLAAVFYDAGSGQGSPYYIGGIITGAMMLTISVLNYVDCGRSTQQKICTVRWSIVLGVGVFTVSLICTLVVCIIGLQIQDCDISAHAPVCVRNKLIQNRITAIFMLIFLMGGVVVNGLCTALLLMYYRSLSRNTRTEEEGAMPPAVIIHPGVSSCGNEYNPNNQDQPAALNTATQSGASGSYRGTTLSIPSHNVPGAQQPQNNDAISQLEEQNRLLREQIALQQQMMQLQQQQQQHSPLRPVMGEPPSYESSINSSQQVQTLQEQIRHLQDLCHHQQQQLPEKEGLLSPNDGDVTPSAPPLTFLPPSED